MNVVKTVGASPFPDSTCLVGVRRKRITEITATDTCLQAVESICKNSHTSTVCSSIMLRKNVSEWDLKALKYFGVFVFVIFRPCMHRLPKIRERNTCTKVKT